MHPLHPAAHSVSPAFEPALAFSICTLVSKESEYRKMVDSFIEAGFTSADCEFLYADNSKHNQFDAYSGLNRLLTEAKGKYIILCHQDILLSYDKRPMLEQRIREIEEKDSSWAILSNAGAADLKRLAYKLTVADQEYQEKGEIPLQVQSVDEHFMLLKKTANLGLSADLVGFHLYGTDLCLQAAMRGYTAWVIDFHLYHASKGNPDASFFALRKALIARYQKAWRGRFIRSTITKIYVSASCLKNTLFNSPPVYFLVKQVQKWRA